MPRLSDAQRDRSTYLGATDVAAIVGVSPWVTPYELYLEKIGELDRAAADSPDRLKAQERGHRLEDVALNWLADERGIQLERVHRDVVHPSHPFIVVHPDARERPWRSTRHLIEAKTSRRRWDQLPQYVEAQVQMQMAAAGAERATVACLTWDGLDTFDLERNPELIAALEDAAVAFWQRVQDRQPPPMDGSRGASKYLDRMFTGEPEAMAGRDQRDLLQALLAVREQLERVTETEARLVNQLKQSMAGGSRLVAPGLARVVWTDPKPRSTTAWKDVAAEQGHLLELIDEWEQGTGEGPGTPWYADLERWRDGRLEAAHTTTTEGVRAFRVTPEEPKSD